MARKSASGKVAFVIIGVLLLALGWMWYSGGSAQTSVPFTPPTTVAETPLYDCGDDKQGTLYIQAYNVINTSGAEYYAMTFNVYDSNGVKVGTITTPSSSSSWGNATFNCGEKLLLRGISADGASGDNARVRTIAQGKGAKIVNGGDLEVTIDDNEVYVIVGTSQHATLEFRAWDKVEASWIYDDQDASNNDWETTGVTFKSKTDNSTPITVGTDGYLDMKYEVRTVQTDTDYADFGMYILVDADKTDWKEPSVKWEGKTLKPIDLTGDEAAAYSAYEYVYYVDASVMGIDGDPSEPVVSRTPRTLDFYIEAKSGVNPDMDPVIAFASIGQYNSIVAGRTGRGAVKDDGSNSQVFTLQSFTQDIN